MGDHILPLHGYKDELLAPESGHEMVSMENGDGDGGDDVHRHGTYVHELDWT